MGKLGHRVRSIGGNVAHRHVVVVRGGDVDDVVAGGQHADEPHRRTALKDRAAQGSLVGVDDFCVADAPHDLVVVVQRRAIVHRQLAKGFQTAPAQISGILRVSIQDYDFHKLHLPLVDFEKVIPPAPRRGSQRASCRPVPALRPRPSRALPQRTARRVRQRSGSPPA